MKDYIDAAYRGIGIVLMVLGAMAGAATCGVQYGQTHGASR